MQRKRTGKTGLHLTSGSGKVVAASAAKGANRGTSVTGADVAKENGFDVQPLVSDRFHSNINCLLSCGAPFGVWRSESS